MRKFLVLLALLALPFFAINAQETVKRVPDDTLRLNIEVKATDVKLPIQDVSSIYNQINELKTSSKTEYDGIMSRIALLDNKMDNIVYKESDAKISYITSNFGMTKDDISKAVRRSSTNKAVAIAIPLILLIYLWGRTLQIRQLDAINAMYLVIIGLILALATSFVLYTILQGALNQNAAILSQLQKLL